jgi:ribosomal-protein-alanine N-acetyltransferase
MIIETPRLRLREFVTDDWPAVLAYQSDPRYLTYYAWTGRTEADVRAFVSQFVAWQASVPRLKYQLAVTLRDGGELIGNCGVRLEGPGSRTADFGYEIAPVQWGRGYATEAARAMVGFGFEGLGLQWIWGECVSENAASRRVMEKLGMHCQARPWQTQWIKGQWWHTVACGVLVDDWRQGMGQNWFADHAVYAENMPLRQKTGS